MLYTNLEIRITSPMELGGRIHVYMSNPAFILESIIKEPTVFSLDNTHRQFSIFGASTNRFIYFSAERRFRLLLYHEWFRCLESSVAILNWLKNGYCHQNGPWRFQQCRYSYYPEQGSGLTLGNYLQRTQRYCLADVDLSGIITWKPIGFTFDGVQIPRSRKSMISDLKSKGFSCVRIMIQVSKPKRLFSYEEGLEAKSFFKYPDGKISWAKYRPGMVRISWLYQVWDLDLGVGRENGLFILQRSWCFWTIWMTCILGFITPNLIEFDFEGRFSFTSWARNVYGCRLARSVFREGSLPPK